MLIIKIQNNGTGTDSAANYRYQVMVNEKIIESGSIMNHNRKNGWRNLVGMMLPEMYELRNKNAALHRFTWWVIQVYARNVQDLIASIKQSVTYETPEEARKGKYALPRRCFVISERLEVYNKGIEDGDYLDPEILKEVSG